MIPKLIGYLAKRKFRRDGPVHGDGTLPFPAPSHVQEICSVSDCIADASPGWLDLSKQNGYGLYDNPGLAWDVVPADLRPAFEMFAYRLYLVQFVDGREEPMELRPGLNLEPKPRTFVRLGWDAVEGGAHHGFGCSPLSCNGQAGQDGLPVVNRYCLASTRADGFALARTFSISKPEPGPYCVVEVWREGQ